MKKILPLLAALAFTGVAQAQIYKWVDKDGKLRFGDAPPAGVKATLLPGSSAPATAAPPASAAAAAKEAKKTAATPASPQRAQSAKQDKCERSKETLRTLESGLQVTRTNPSGERYVLSQAHIDQEIAKTRESIKKSCN